MNHIPEITPEIARFRQSHIWRARLAEILEDPVMKEAIKAVLSLSTPRSVPSPVAGNHPDTVIAHVFYNMLGVVKAVNAFNLLSSDGGPTGLQLEQEDDPFAADIAPEFKEMPAALKEKKATNP